MPDLLMGTLKNLVFRSELRHGRDIYRRYLIDTGAWRLPARINVQLYEEYGRKTGYLMFPDVWKRI